MGDIQATFFHRVPAGQCPVHGGRGVVGSEGKVASFVWEFEVKRLNASSKGV